MINLYRDLGYQSNLEKRGLFDSVPTAAQSNFNNGIARAAMIANGIVTDSKIKDLAVTNSKIDNLAVDNSKIKDLAVTNGKIDNLAVDNSKIADLNTDKLTTGTMTAVASVGAGNVKIDGVNKRIIVNDGTNDRILIGYLAGKF